MTEFESVAHGLAHQLKCPLCGHDVHVNGRYWLENLEDPATGNTCRFSFWLNKSEDSVLYLFPLTNRVEISKGKYTGTYFQGLQSACGGCNHYRYTLKIEIDLSTPKINKVSLNSETVMFKHDQETYEITSIYSTGKTEYMVLREKMPGDAKPLELPLIPINLQAPRETLERIQNLIIFS